MAAAAPVLAHSLEEVDQGLRDKEKYFQPVDSEAPGFSLQDATGRTVSLSGLRGKVVVLMPETNGTPSPRSRMFCPSLLTVSP
jgi:protein SCO1/2